MNGLPNIRWQSKPSFSCDLLKFGFLSSRRVTWCGLTAAMELSVTLSLVYQIHLRTVWTSRPHVKMNQFLCFVEMSSKFSLLRISCRIAFVLCFSYSWTVAWTRLWRSQSVCLCQKTACQETLIGPSYHLYYLLDENKNTLGILCQWFFSLFIYFFFFFWVFCTI